MLIICITIGVVLKEYAVAKVILALIILASLYYASGREFLACGMVGIYAWCGVAFIMPLWQKKKSVWLVKEQVLSFCNNNSLHVAQQCSKLLEEEHAYMCIHTQDKISTKTSLFPLSALPEHC
uniref:Uncharacterized protein n=1 Tax=Amblyomma triste TaxID=251400 RepID=A0A023G0Q6_AMBTT